MIYFKNTLLKNVQIHKNKESGIDMIAKIPFLKNFLGPKLTQVEVDHCNGILI